VMRRPGFVPWPEEAAERYAAAGHWRDRPLGHWMWTWADRHGDRVAVVDGDRRVTYRELAEAADAVADGLSLMGLKDHDNVLVQLPNRWEFLALFFGCLRAGVAPVLALLPHREHELGYLARLADVAAIVVPDEWQGFDHQELAARLAGRRRRIVVLGERVKGGHADLAALVRPRKDPAGLRRALDDCAPGAREVALFLLSGGTTGEPKIIPRTHADYEYNARTSAAVCGFDEHTVYLAVLPAAHNFPLGSPGILGTLMAGGRVVLSRSPRPEVAFPLIERERVTVTSLVPAIAQRWIEAAASATYDLFSLSLVQVGGSVMPPGLVTQIGPLLGARPQQVYGMAEGLLNYTRPDDPAEVVEHTQGRPISPADEILIVDEDDRPVPEGGSGELLTRGPYTTRGYFASAEHNRRAFTPDGWYRTGDVVRLHPTGNLVVAGRVKDLINRGGEKIASAEVEALVKAMPAVRQVSAIALPDARMGERICVCVTLLEGRRLTLEEVRAEFLRRGVAAYKLPEQLEVLAELPLTPIGKVDKKSLRDRFAGDHARGERSD
jgi:2,3-dihydroxybenzoate-AMP ligase